jgi:hypothetical protein
MRRILIVGAGQAGLQLALGLLASGYDVTVMSARTPEEIRHGRILSTQAMFDPTLQFERDLGINFWESKAPQMVGLRVTLSAPPGEIAFGFMGRWDAYGQSVDQRVKMAGWLEHFEAQGGEVVYHGVMTSDLEKLTTLYDLTIIAAGRGDLVELFDRDDERSVHDRPQRMLSSIYLHGMEPRPDYPEPHVRLNAFPGIGELLYMKGYTNTGPTDILLWEGVPGGPFDCWSDRPNPQDHLERTRELTRRYVPWEHELLADAEPTDARCTLYGGFPPVVRKPVGTVSATSHVLGMADVVVAVDPVSGQGANNAARCADMYLRAIIERGSRPFDPEWMEQTFEAYWAAHARHVTAYANTLLDPPEHVQQALGAAAQYPDVAYRFGMLSPDPTDYPNWLADPELTQAYLAEVAAKAEA